MRNPIHQKDKNKFCQFHSDHDPKTKDCVTLWFDITSLLRKWWLCEFLTKKGKQTLEKSEENQQEAKTVEMPTKTSQVKRIIGVIYCGLTVSEIT